MKKLVALMALCALFTGCASTPKTKFAEFYESPGYPEKLTVVLDSIVRTDIEGSALGINKEKNAEAMSLVESSVKELLEERGHTVDVTYQGNGIGYQMDENTEYFYSEDWKATEEQFLGPVSQSENDLWVTDEGKAFIQQLITSAKETNANAMNSETLISEVEVPAFVKDLPSDLLIFVRVTSGDVGSGKSIGTGLLTGVLSAALTGGAFVYVGTFVSGSEIDVVAFDTSTAEVVWYNNIPQGAKYKNIGYSMKLALKEFPTVDGEVLK